MPKCIFTIVAVAIATVGVASLARGQNQTELEQQSKDIEKLERLERQIQLEAPQYIMHPRIRFFGGKIDPLYKDYVEQCLNKVLETSRKAWPGEINGVQGSVMVTFLIEANGRLKNVQVSKSSGQSSLDQTMVNFIHWTAPFDPFPESIKNDADEISITRTFSFASGDNSKNE